MFASKSRSRDCLIFRIVVFQITTFNRLIFKCFVLDIFVYFCFTLGIKFKNQEDTAQNMRQILRLALKAEEFFESLLAEDLNNSSEELKYKRGGF